MKSATTPAWNPARLDVRSLAAAAGSLEGETPLTALERLAEDLTPTDDQALAGSVRWRARAEQRPGPAGGEPSIWLHLHADAVVPLSCQRCLAPVDTPLEVDRWFRFVADEATAEAEDDDCEEDLLALEPRPDLIAVLEDELIMSLPVLPMHDTCPQPLLPPVGPPAAVEAPSPRPNPFAALQALKRRGD